MQVGIALLYSLPDRSCLYVHIPSIFIQVFYKQGNAVKQEAWNSTMNLAPCVFQFCELCLPVVILIVAQHMRSRSVFLRSAFT